MFSRFTKKEVLTEPVGRQVICTERKPSLIQGHTASLKCTSKITDFLAPALQSALHKASLPNKYLLIFPLFHHFLPSYIYPIVLYAEVPWLTSTCSITCFLSLLISERIKNAFYINFAALPSTCLSKYFSCKWKTTSLNISKSSYW